MEETLTVFVPIKRDTIRPNPKAGNTRTVISTGQSITYSYAGRLPKAYKDAGFIEDGWRVENGTIIESEGTIRTLTTKIGEIIASKDPLLTIIVDSHPEVIEHRPERDYFFDYEDPAFTVPAQGEMRVSDLETECDDDGCWLVHKQTGEFVDVKLQYEKVADALKRNA